MTTVVHQSAELPPALKKKCVYLAAPARECPFSPLRPVCPLVPAWGVFFWSSFLVFSSWFLGEIEIGHEALEYSVSGAPCWGCYGGCYEYPLAQKADSHRPSWGNQRSIHTFLEWLCEVCVRARRTSPSIKHWFKLQVFSSSPMQGFRRTTLPLNLS